MIFQVIFAISLVILLFIIGFSIYNMELLNAIRSSGVIKSKVEIFKGVKDFKQVTGEMYNTQDKNSASYREIIPSYNQQAGAEYSYNFWLYIDKSQYANCKNSTSNKADPGFTTDSLADKNQTILFMKGVPKYTSYENICTVEKKDIMIKSPLVKLEQCGNNLTVEFNTMQSTDAINENSPNTCSTNGSWKDANSHKITLSGLTLGDPGQRFDRKWNMFSVIIQDTFPTDPYPIRNKVRCRIYVNGLLELDRYVDGKLSTAEQNDKTPTVLKFNKGHLYINPEISIAVPRAGKDPLTLTTYRPVEDYKLMMADLNYFNYALSPGELDELFNNGFEKSFAPTAGGDNLDTTYFTIAEKPTKKQLIS
uniref:Uncharacterized protein n=1 Tax=viral metagenome TaxID=1070528 RepID=A0A6C0CRV1_9ZZZZ